MDNLYFNPKRLRKIANRRSCRTMKIWGWILTALGGISILEGLGQLLSGHGVASVFDGLIFLIPGLILLWYARRQVSRWDRYEALIDNKGNTSIRMLCEKMKLPEKTVHADLYRMIGNDFFIGPNYNIESYIDGERDLLVMAVGGRPLKPLPEVSPKEAEREAARDQQTSEAACQDNEDLEMAGREKEGHGSGTKDRATDLELTDLEIIRKVITETSDDGVRNSLYGIEGSLRRIDERIQGDSALRNKPGIRKLYKYYVPQIMDLIREYRDRNTSEEMKKQIGDALHTSAGALANIEADLLEKEQMDLEVDIQVLRNMFAQDGLLKPASGAKAMTAEDKARAETEAETQTETRVEEAGML